MLSRKPQAQNSLMATSKTEAAAARVDKKSRDNRRLTLFPVAARDSFLSLFI